MNEYRFDGWHRVAKPLARNAYEQGEEVGICASNMRAESFMAVFNKEDAEAPESFDALVNAYEYYNCTNETGRYASFFLKDEEPLNEDFGDEIPYPELDKLLTDLCDYIDDRYEGPLCEPDGIPRKNTVSIFIDGDWKHEHGFCDYVAEEFFESSDKYALENTQQYVTEDDRSDWYGAMHMFTVSRKNSKLKEGYRGSNVEFKWNGTQSDPDLIYNGYTFNYYDIEDALWGEFLEETGYTDDKSKDPEVEEEFNKYVQERVEDYLEDVIFGGYFEDGKKSWKESLQESYLVAGKRSDYSKTEPIKEVLIDKLCAENGIKPSDLKLYFVLGDTYSIKDQLKAEGARFFPELRVWYFIGYNSMVDNLQTEVVDKNGLVVSQEYFKYGDYPVLELDPVTFERIEDANNTAKRNAREVAMQNLHQQRVQSGTGVNYVGNIGDRITFTATGEFIDTFTGAWGDYYGYKFTTEDGDVIYSESSKDIDDATLKNKTTYRGTVVKQYIDRHDGACVTKVNRLSIV